MPLMVNPVPEALAAEMVTLAVPEFVNVTVCDPLLPTSTLPKLTLAGLGVSCPCTPVPARDRKSTRLNSSHVRISYAVFCLKKKKNGTWQSHIRRLHSCGIVTT